MNVPHPLLAIVGPTASGKSDLALLLAEDLAQRGAEIINCDSVQLYRHFDIGTAKPAPVERRGVPHHLLDALDPRETCTAGEYARRARAVLDDLRVRGAVPIFVGGTGFYLRATLEGLFPGPARDDELRRRLARRAGERSGAYLHRLLRRLDPASASRIHANDAPKMIRAIEVCLRARRPMSALFRETQGHGKLEGFRVLKIGLAPPRRELCERINSRAARMFHGGLLDEVRDILARGVPRTAKPFQSHGYMEALAVVEGRMTLEEAITSTQVRTRQYAKRQMTWFRRERGVHWLAAFGDAPATQHAALDWAQMELGVRLEE